MEEKKGFSGSGEFEDPSQGQAGVETSAEEAEIGGFVPPAAEAAAEGEVVFDPSMAQAVPAELLEIKATVEQFLTKNLSEAAAAGAVSVQEAEGAGNIQGVGISEADELLGIEPGTPTLTVYVAEPASMEQVKAALVDTMGIAAASSDSVPVNVVVTGIIDAFPHRFRIRPVPAGVSIAHCKVTAGTLGCFARGRSGTTRYNRLMLLSNNHVIANSNNARLGDYIIQPGPADGGKCTTTDRIAILERFVTIRFGGPANYVDCATGWCWPNLIRPDRAQVYRTASGLAYFKIGSQICACQRGMWVGKSGRTTQLTRGSITDCNATIRVNYGGGKVALFKDQMAIKAPSGNFSAGGDSGSVIWTWDSRRCPVGLLFAGGGGITFANKMNYVVAALDIMLYN